MSKYSCIAAEFSRMGYYDSMRLTQYQMNAVLDKIAQSNMGINQFEREVAAELFEQTTKASDGSVLIRDYIGIILHAHAALEKHIANSIQQLKWQKSEMKREQIRAGIQQFQEDLRLLTLPFHIPTKQVFSEKAHTGGPVSSMDNSTVSDSEGDVTPLIVLFILACVGLLFQLLCAFVKNHFLNLLVVAFLLAIFFLNYFDKLYVKACILSIGASVLMDVIWLAVMWGKYWNPGQTHRSSFRQGYLRFTCVTTIILMVLRFAIAALLYQYRNNRADVRIVLEIFTLRFRLSGQGSNSPLTIALQKRSELVGIY